MVEKSFLGEVNLGNQFVFDFQRFADDVVATVKLGDAEAVSFTDIEEAFSAISSSDAKDITLTMKQVVSLSSPLDLEIADTVTFKNPDWLVCHPDSNKPTLRIKSGTFIIDKVNLEGDRELVENMGVKDNGTAIADEAEVIMYMPVGEDNQPMYINMKDVSSARIASTSDSIPIYFDTFEHAMNHLDEDDQTVIVMETADAGLDGVLSYTGTGDKADNSFKLEGLAKASDITIGADKTFDITSANFSSDGITVVDGGKYTFNLVSSTDSTEAPTSFTGSDGAEKVNNEIAQLKINGADGADQITNYGASVSIDGGAGDDSIANGGDNVTINGGADNDNIVNRGVKTLIDAGDGINYIFNYSSDNTIITGDDGDYILNSVKSAEDASPDNVSIASGAGNDTISNDGDFVTIDAGAGDDRIISYGASVSIDGGAGMDAIGNGADNMTINGGADSDTITNMGMYDSINGGDGADLLYNLAHIDEEGYLITAPDNTTINGGDGADYIINEYGNDVMMNGDDGDDLIVNEGGNAVIVNGGANNDSITNMGTNVSINGGDGADVIYNWAQVDEEGYLMTAPDNTTINGDDGDDFILNEYGNSVLISGGEGDDSIGSFGDSVTIDGGAGDDYIEIDGANVLIQYKTGDGNDTIYGLNETSTLSIDEGAGSYSTQFSGDDIIVTVGDNKITLKGARDNPSHIVIGESGEDNNLTLTNKSAAKVTLDSSYEVADASTRTKAIKLVGNTLDNTIFGGSGKDTLYGKDGADYLVGNDGNDKLYGQDGADTLWGGKGNDTLTGGDGNDLFIYSAGKDVIADYAAGDTISIGAAISKSSLSGNNAILTIGSNTLTIKNGKGKELSLIEADGTARTIIGGAALLSNSSSSKVTLGSTYSVADASDRTKAIKITGNTLDNTIFGGSGKDTLYGKDGADYLAGNAGNDKLYGQDGNDTLYGGSGNDTLNGGAGNDFFVYTSGSDVIADYAAGDVISISSAISSAYAKGSDVLLKTANGTLTVKNAKNAELSLIDSTGTELSTIVSNATLNLTNNSSSKVTVPSTMSSADASARTKAITIVGNSKDNTILGGSGNDKITGVNGADYLAGGAGKDKLWGGSGNDTLWGGIGNDTLKGDAGSDTFIYNAGEGKDVIIGFANDDMLQITETFTASVSSAGNIVFKVGSTASAITLKNFTADTFNINGDTYAISDKKLVKQ